MAIVVIPLLIIIIAIPVLIGVYVYRDAAQRGMNAALWTLIAVFAPSLIGLIIYLLVRGSYADLKCPVCATPVTELYLACPKCGAKLRASCTNCGNPLEIGWKVCPKCAAPLPEFGEEYLPPLRKKDSALGKILVLAIAIPLLLLVLLAVFSFSVAGKTSSMGTTQMSLEDYRDCPDIITWINSCDEDKSQTYALCYKDESVNQKATYYLFYQPTDSGIDSFSVGKNAGLFSSYAEIKIYTNPYQANAGNELTCISNSSDKFIGLKVFVNGKKIDCKITEVDFNPVLR